MSVTLERPRAAVTSVIAMSRITKVYDTGKIRVEALKGVDLNIGAGEFVAIVGPSGSGKSTLMNLIGCLDTPTQGTYLLRDKEVAGLDKNELARIRNERVGFVFQNFNLLPQITAFENVEMPLMFGGVPKKARKERVCELLEKVGRVGRDVGADPQQAAHLGLPAGQRRQGGEQLGASHRRAAHDLHGGDRL